MSQVVLKVEFVQQVLAPAQVFRNDNILEGGGQVGGENPLEYHPFIFIVSK